jgi:6,7-dimethyl-8-ribityllumazine synthase
MKLGIVKADYNQEITDKMLESAEQRAEDMEINIVEKMHVPGAYDTPLAADRLARKNEVDAVVVIGAIVEGDTDHDKIIGQTAADKLSEISLERDTPVLLSITGPGMTAEEAAERTHYAGNAVESAKQLVEELSSE